MITIRDETKSLLTGRGIKPTYQRAVILESVLGKDGHPTIRALHEKLVREVPTLSKTTLYATLELFARKGLVAPLFIDPSEVRYDGIPEPHHHFYCASCRRILDVEIACATGRAGRLHGHRIDEVHGYFKGVCRDCLSAGRAARPAPPQPQAPNTPRRKAHA
jgi:Fur family peroxide stress response transcriptional regulator